MIRTQLRFMTTKTKYDNSLRSNRSQLFVRPHGFTLIELLVVIAIIAILAAILMPVLNRAKARAQTAFCLNNMKQLQITYLMYVHDNNDTLPYCALGGFWGTVPSWITNGNEQANILLDGIRYGALYQYNQNVKIYVCPANTKNNKLVNSGDVIPARKEYGNNNIVINSILPMVRTCSIDFPLGGYNANSAGPGSVLSTGSTALVKYGDIKSPDPGVAQMIVFCDENEYSVDDGAWALEPASSGQNRWQNAPGARHNNGTTWSFADGHVEYWKWHGGALLAAETPSYAPYWPADNSDDLSRVRACTPQ